MTTNPEFAPLNHPKFTQVQIALFQETLAPDCMTHTCKLHPSGTTQLEACCQYGADVDLYEREAILARQNELIPLVNVSPDEWFTKEVHTDPDFPSGQHVRTAKRNEGCLFLGHDKRGCAIHRAAVENGWDFREAKPHICRLFPVSYTDKAIVVSDDYIDYSCAYTEGAPSIFQVCREEILHVFGSDITNQLDQYQMMYPPNPMARKKLPVIETTLSE